MKLTERQINNFWKKVEKTDTCWLWTGAISGGYGNVSINREFYRAHRIAWLLTGNIIPSGHVMRHKCNSKNCVNPTHLESGTQADNIADMKRDGTYTHGESHSKAKLTTQQVLELRARGKEDSDILSKEYHISRSTVYHIIRRKGWKHI